jgi:hypothetical protein
MHFACRTCCRHILSSLLRSALSNNASSSNSSSSSSSSASLRPVALRRRCRSISSRLSRSATRASAAYETWLCSFVVAMHTCALVVADVKLCSIFSTILFIDNLRHRDVTHCEPLQHLQTHVSRSSFCFSLATCALAASNSLDNCSFCALRSSLCLCSASHCR